MHTHIVWEDNMKPAYPLRWRHGYKRHGVSNQRQLDCLFVYSTIYDMIAVFYPRFDKFIPARILELFLLYLQAKYRIS